MKAFSFLSAALAFSLADAYLVSPPGAAAPGTTSSCSGWIQMSYALTCEIIEQYYGMTEAQFVSWNPSVALLGDGCNLISGLYYCVEVSFVTISVSHTPPPSSTTSRSATTTSAGNGIATPTPVQTGMVANCNKFYFVASGDGCFDIAAANNIALADFYAWNPAVKNDCTGLFPGYYVCVGTAGAKPTSTSTSRTTTTSAGNGIATPTPTQTGMVKNCNKFYLVVSGDGCFDIAAANNIALDDFYTWNPAVKTDCSGLFPSYYVCVGIVGSSTPSKTTSAIATPTPYQDGMTKSCRGFHLVVSGDSCYDIANAAGISLDSFYGWNPGVGTGCTTLWPGYYVCIKT
ncbi:carbohydrate-binding module family 50 protein [Trichoderma novae-zelandiae]